MPISSAAVSDPRDARDGEGDGRAVPALAWAPLLAVAITLLVTEVALNGFHGYGYFTDELYYLYHVGIEREGARHVAGLYAYHRSNHQLAHLKWASWRCRCVSRSRLPVALLPTRAS